MLNWNLPGPRYEDKGQGDRLVARKAARSRGIVVDHQETASMPISHHQESPLHQGHHDHDDHNDMNQRDTLHLPLIKQPSSSSFSNHHENPLSTKSKHEFDNNDVANDNQAFHTRHKRHVPHQSEENFAGSFFENRKRWQEKMKLENLKHHGSSSINRETSVAVDDIDKEMLSKLKLHEDILHVLEEQENYRSLCSMRRKQIRESFRELSRKREYVERAVGMPHVKIQGRLQYLQKDEIDEIEKSKMKCSMTKRTFRHPDFDEAYIRFIDQNKDLILLRQLHRERDINKRRERQENRENFELQLGTPYAKEKIRRYRKPKPKLNISASDRDAMLEIDAFERKFKQHQKESEMEEL